MTVNVLTSFSNLQPLGNYVVMYMFTKKKELRSPINNYIVNLALADMCMLWSQTPLYLYNVFNGGNWQFGPLACQMAGAANSVFGICSICTIGAMTIERYNVVVRGSPPDRLTYSKSPIRTFFLILLILFQTLKSC